MSFSPGFSPSLSFGLIHLQAKDLSKGQVEVRLGGSLIDVIQIKLGDDAVVLRESDLEALAKHIQALYFDEIPRLQHSSSVGSPSPQIKSTRFTRVVATIENKDVKQVKKGDFTYIKGEDANNLIGTVKDIHDLILRRSRGLSSSSTQTDSLLADSRRDSDVSSRSSAHTVDTVVRPCLECVAKEGLLCGMAALQAELDGARTELQGVQGSLAVAQANLDSVSVLKEILEARIASKDQEISTLTDQIEPLREKGQEVSALSASLSALEAERDDLVSRLSAAQASVEYFEGVLRRLSGQFQEVAADTSISKVIDSLEGAIRAKIAQVSALEAGVAGLEGDFDAAVAVNSNLKERIEELGEEIDSLQEEKQGLQLGLDRLVGTLGGHRIELIDLIKEHLPVGDSRDLDNLSLDEIRSKLAQIIESLNDGIEDLEGQLDRLEGELSTSQAEVARLQKERISLTESIHRLTEDNRAKDLAIAAQAIELTRQSADITTHVVRAAAFQKKIDELSGALSLAQEAGGASAEAQRFLASELATARAGLEEVNSLLDGLCKALGCESNKDLLGKVSSLRETLALSQEKGAALRGELGLVRADKDREMAEKAALTAELDSTLAAHEQALSQLKTVHGTDRSQWVDRISAQEREIVGFREQIDSKLQEIARLGGVESSLNSRIGGLEATLASVRAEMEAANEVLRDEKDQLGQEIARNQEEMARQRENLGEQERRISELSDERTQLAERVAGLQVSLKESEALGGETQAALRAQLADAHSRHEAVNDRLAAVRSALGCSGTEDDTSLLVKGLRDSLGELEARNSAVQDELRQVGEARAAQESAKKDCMAELAQALASMKELRDQHGTDSSQQAAQIAAQEAKITALVEELEAKSRQINLLEGGKATLSSDLDGVRVELGALSATTTAANQALREENDQLKQKAIANAVIIAAQEAILAEQVASIEALSQEAAGLKQRVAELDSQMTQAAASGGEVQAALAAQLKEARSELEDVKARLSALCQVIGVEDNPVSLVKALQENLAALGSTNSGIRSELESVGRDRVLAESTISRLSAQLDSERSVHKATIAQLSQQHESLSAEQKRAMEAQKARIEQFTKNLTARSQELADLGEVESSLRSKLNGVREELADLQSTTAAAQQLLTAQNEQLRQEAAANAIIIADQKAALIGQEARIRDLLEEASGLQSKIGELGVDLQKAKASGGEGQLRSQVLAGELDGILSQLADVKAKLQGVCKALGCDGADPSSQIIELKRRLEALQTANKDIESDLESMRQARDVAESERLRLREALASATQAHEETILTIRDQHQSASAQAAVEQAGALAVQAAQIKGLSQDLFVRSQEIAQLKTAETALQSQLDKVHQELALCQKTTAATNGALQAENVRLRQEAAVHTSTIAQQLRDLDDKTASIEAISARASSFEKRIAELDEALARAKRAGSQGEEARRDLTKELEEARSGFETVSGKVAALCSEFGCRSIAEVHDEILRLQQKLRDLQASNLAFQASLSEVTQARNVAESSIDSLLARLKEVGLTHEAAIRDLKAGQASIIADLEGVHAATIGGLQDGYRRTISDLRTEHDNARAQSARTIADQEADLIAIRKELSAKLRDIDGFRGVEANLSATLASMTQDLAFATSEVSRLKVANRSLVGENESLVEANRSLAGRLRQVDLELEQKEKELGASKAAMVEAATKAEALGAELFAAKAEATAREEVLMARLRQMEEREALLKGQLLERVVPVDAHVAPAQVREYTTDVEALREMIARSNPPARAVVDESANIARARAENLKRIIEAIPPVVANAHVEALTSSEVKSDIELYAAVLNEVMSHSAGDRKVLILNLMLVIANHRPEMVNENVEYKKYLAKAFLEADVRANQIAAAICDQAGIASPDIVARASKLRGESRLEGSIPNYVKDGFEILKETLAHLATLDSLLKPPILSDDARRGIKARAETYIKTYLGRLGFEMSASGVENLAKYVCERGQFPPAIMRYLTTTSSETSYSEPLAKMFYLYSACSSQYQERFKSVVSLEELDWLKAGRNSNEASSVWLSFIKNAGEIAFTHEQAKWGREVAKAMDGRKADPINAPGGAGKTRTVQHFMKILSDIPPPKGKMIFVSPFAHEAKLGDDGKIINAMIPAPTRANEILINVGSMSQADMGKAKVVIDECHIIRPEMTVFLVNNQGKKMSVSTYLQLTASPLTSGYDLIETLGESLASIQTEREELQRRLAAFSDVNAEEKRKLVAIKAMFGKESEYIRTITKIAEVQGTTGTAKKGLDTLVGLLEKGTSTFDGGVVVPAVTTSGYYEEVGAALKQVLGGWLTPGNKGSGILGNKLCLEIFIDPKLKPPEGLNLDGRKVLLRRLELLALDVDPALGSVYKSQTTEIIRTKEAALKPLGSIEAAVDRRFLDEVDREHKNDPIIAKKEAIEKALKALDQQTQELSRLRKDCEESRSLETYKTTKSRREATLGAMKVVPSDLLSWSSQKEDCVVRAKEALESVDQSYSKRVQMIFPGLRFNRANLRDLTTGLGSSEKSRVFIYHDSEPGSATFGQNCCIKVPGNGDPISLETYKKELKREGNLEISDILRSEDQIIMLYDDTNKQGGDYDLFSQAIADQHAPISQLIFLDIGEDGVNPREKLSSGDLYQAYCRRRRNKEADDIPPPIVFSKPKTRPITDLVLGYLPLKMLSDAVMLDDSSVSSAVRRELFERYKGDRTQLITHFKSEIVAGLEKDSEKISLVYDLEDKQTRIELLLQQGEAVAYIADQILSIQEGAESLTSLTSEVTRLGLRERVRFLRDVSDKDMLKKLRSVSTIIDSVGVLFASLKEANRPEGKKETSVRGRSAAAFSTPHPAHSVAVYETSVSALNRVKLIQAYLGQSGFDKASVRAAE